MIEVLSDPIHLVIMVPVAGLILGAGLAIVGMVIKHRERVATVEMGIGPDHVLFDDEDAERGANQPV